MWAAVSPSPGNTIIFLTTKQPPRRPFMVITALKSNEAAAAAKGKLKYTAAEELSGADVLMALQKATAAKKDRRRDMAMDIGGKNNKKTKTKIHKMDASRDTTDIVRPLCIKPEWTHQLHDLEIRLQQLTHTS